ncbi:hypothetical protein [Haloechinothrix sp. LS1_15]|nr:hypothetical protein [Haloechinothrix sp. LS1_15]
MFLHVGWALRAPQDGICIDPALVARLAQLGAYILLDTYTDSGEG